MKVSGSFSESATDLGSFVSYDRLFSFFIFRICFLSFASAFEGWFLCCTDLKRDIICKLVAAALTASASIDERRGAARWGLVSLLHGLWQDAK